MRRLLLLGLTAATVMVAGEIAPGNELAFQIGGFTPVSRSGLRLDPGIALQANYAHLLAEGRLLAIYGEVHFLASPQRLVSNAPATATRDEASLYITPGFRVKFLPGRTFSPYFALGGGLAWYEQSNTRIDGQPNAAPREIYRGAFDFAGGSDIRVWRWLALRGELRDFYTGAPAYNLPSLRGGQHNVIASTAFVLRWH